MIQIILPQCFALNICNFLAHRKWKNFQNIVWFQAVCPIYCSCFLTYFIFSTLNFDCGLCAHQYWHIWGFGVYHCSSVKGEYVWFHFTLLAPLFHWLQFYFRALNATSLQTRIMHSKRTATVVPCCLPVWQYSEIVETVWISARINQPVSQNITTATPSLCMCIVFFFFFYLGW